MRIPTRRRRWFQFSLRTLLILLTVSAVWLGYFVERARTQREVVKALRGKGRMYYRHWLTGQRIETLRSLPEPDWLRRLVGNEYFFRPHYVVVDAAGPILDRLREIDSIQAITVADGGPITSEHVGAIAGIRSLTKVNLGQMVQFPLLSFDGSTLDRLADLPHLKAIDLDALTINDDDLTRLARVKQLERLQIFRGQVTHAGLRHLTALPRLTRLELWDLPLTDEGMVHLKCLPSLQSLTLVNVGLTDAGLDHLLELRNLESLAVGENAITDAGVAKIVSLKNVRDLDLASIPITTDGLAMLRDLPNLEKLSLGHTELTDDGLVELERLTNLKDLCLPQAVAGNPAVAGLKKSLPACSIRFY